MDKIYKREAGKVSFVVLNERRYLIYSKSISNMIEIFWKCFKCALASNKNPNRKGRILSIIANEFIYKELK